MAINTGRVIGGGLAAGVVMNVCDMVTGMFIMQDEFNANLTRLNLDPAAMNTTAGMVPWIVIDFLMGILLVWTYAAMRPRFGAGPKTAVYSVMPAYLAVTVMMYGLSSLGMWSNVMWAKMAAISLVTMVLANVAGAWLYRED